MAIEAPIILYVDDDESNRLVFEHSFRREFPMQTAASGPEALSLLASESVGVLITDQRMPGMSGNELLECVKEKFPGVIRVVLTAYSDLGPIIRAVNDGLVARYIVKPWQHDELAAVISWAQEAHLLSRHDSELRQRLQAVERLVMLGSIHAGVFHDLAQPLNLLALGMGELERFAPALKAIASLVNQYGDELPAAQRTLLGELIEAYPVHLKEMMASLGLIRAAVNNTSGVLQGGPNPAETCDPLEAFSFAISTSQKEADRCDIAIEFNYADDLPRVAMSCVELQQTLLNLLSNAVHTLQESEPPRRLKLDLEKDGEQVKIGIADNGLGMTPENLNQASVPFFSTKPDGTGIGLHQCRRLVERIGGQLVIETEERVGTTIVLSLPAAP